jgi:hypothetical protein
MSSTYIGREGERRNHGLVRTFIIKFEVDYNTSYLLIHKFDLKKQIIFWWFLRFIIISASVTCAIGHPKCELVTQLKFSFPKSFFQGVI